MQITDKKLYLEERAKGVFGNELRHWPNLASFMADESYTGTVTLRSYTPMSTLTSYRLTKQNVALVLASVGNTDDYYFNESAPDDALTIQGEFFDGTGRRGSFVDRGLIISTERLPMRKAFALSSSSYNGLASELILQAYMNVNSYEDFRIIRDQYPNHAIEFSCYDICLGNIPHRNTLIWEVRSY